MNQDQLIRFLMDNIDAEALAEANRNGSTIMYYAGVAQRFPQIQNAANPRARVSAQRPPVAVEEQAERPNRQPAREAVQDLNENQDNAPIARQPARRPARQANGGADRVRVGDY